MNDDTRYEQLCMNVRFTDDISFKLLGLVPLISGSAIVVALQKGEEIWSPAVFYLSIFGALVIFGLFRWEIRNIRTCNYLLSCISEIDGSNRRERNPAPGLIGEKLRIGKARAEKFIYTITILSWLGMPYAAFSIVRASWDGKGEPPKFEVPDLWLGSVTLLGILLLLSIFAKTKEYTAACGTKNKMET